MAILLTSTLLAYLQKRVNLIDILIRFDCTRFHIELKDVLVVKMGKMVVEKPHLDPLKRFFVNFCR